MTVAVMYRRLPIVEYRYCLCGSYMMNAFPLGTRPLVRRRRFKKWEERHQGKGHGLIDEQTWKDRRYGPA